MEVLESHYQFKIFVPFLHMTVQTLADFQHQISFDRSQLSLFRLILHYCIF